MWTEEDYITLFIALVIYLDLASVAERTRAFGALDYSGSRGLRAPFERDQRPLLGHGTLREVLIRLLRRAALRLVAGGAGKDAGADEPPWPHLISFHLSHPAVNVSWFGEIDRRDNYAPRRAEPLTSPLMVQRTVDVASELVAAAAEALVAELARHDVDPAEYLSSNRSPGI